MSKLVAKNKVIRQSLPIQKFFHMLPRKGVIRTPQKVVIGAASIEDLYSRHLDTVEREMAKRIGQKPLNKKQKRWLHQILASHTFRMGKIIFQGVYTIRRVRDES